MTRYFIGLMTPEPIQAHLSAFAASLQRSLPTGLPSKISWTQPADLHCTVVFIGASDDEHHLIERLTEVALRLTPVTLSVQGPTHWLGRNSLAVKVSGAEELGTIVVREFETLSSDPWVGRRPFHGHITLGRARPKPAADEDYFSGHELPPATWYADCLHLVRNANSHIERKYEIVAEVPLRQISDH